MNTDLAAQRAFDRLARGGFEKLTELEKTLAAAWSFEAGVANRGFASYFSGPEGDMAFHAPAALRAIGAVGMAGIAARANDVFGAGGPPKDRKARRAIVRGLGDETRKIFTDLETRFYESPEDIDVLLDFYLNKKQ